MYQTFTLDACVQFSNMFRCLSRRNKYWINVGKSTNASHSWLTYTYIYIVVRSCTLQEMFLRALWLSIADTSKSCSWNTGRQSAWYWWPRCECLHLIRNPLWLLWNLVDDSWNYLSKLNVISLSNAIMKDNKNDCNLSPIFFSITVVNLLLLRI